MSEILDLQDVTVRRDANEILSRVTWQVSTGQRWVIMGSNGAGKTTLMQISSGYMHPTTGRARILGHEVGKTDAYGISGRWRERYDQVDRDRAHQLLSDWGLTTLANRRIGNLSEGERKRVQIARALMCDPELLILDEPAAGLDVGGREDLVARLATLAGDHNAPSLVLVTHHVEEIPPNFTHALLLKSGQVSSQGPVPEVIASEPMSQAFNIPLVVEYGDGRWYAQGKTPSKGRRARD